MSKDRQPPRRDPEALRLWLRLLAASTQVEAEIRRRLRARFGITLARFDYLAQLHRHPGGLPMNGLSRCLMVTGGSVTGLTDELEKEGWVRREPSASDRRVVRLHLTERGRARFEAVAAEHRRWIVELFGGLESAERGALLDLLGRLRESVGAALEAAPGGKA